MATTGFEDKDIRYAYSSIHDFFNFYGLSGAVQDIDSILKATISKKPFKKADPYSVVCFMEKLWELCGAAFLIHSNYATRDEAILEAPENGEPDMSLKQHFVGRHVPCSVWDYFPRCLTASQYHNPYKAINKFVDFMTEAEWKKAFKEIAEYALSNNSINEEYYTFNIITIRLRLLQLIEACHLLEVRCNMKKSQPKTKKKKSKK